MDKIIAQIMENVKKICETYKENDEYHYDFWNNHIKYVYDESVNLAIKYGADGEIVKIAALLHDIALVTNKSDKKDHHIVGAEITKEWLDDYNIDEEKKKKIINCVYNHRSSKNATNIEELCVADADILAHFDNITMIYSILMRNSKKSLEEIKEEMYRFFEKDYNDLSEKTKEVFKDRYNLILDVVLGIKNNE